MILCSLQIHLFNIDIDVENDGGVKFNEGLVLSPGNDITVVEIDNHKVGIGICHDKRFEELARLYRNQGEYTVRISRIGFTYTISLSVPNTEIRDFGIKQFSITNFGFSFRFDFLV